MPEIKTELPARLGLSIITLNEEINIERCLASVLSAKLVDAVSVVDSRSSDRTVELIKKVCSHFAVPCNIEVIKFKDFASARNLTIPFLKSQNCDYVFQLNADEQIFVNPDLTKSKLINLAVAKDLVYVAVKQFSHTTREARIFRLDEDLKWVGLCYEYIQSQTLNFQNSELMPDEALCIVSNINRNTWTDKQKADQLAKHEKLLLKQISLTPSEPRWVYHLAQVYNEQNTTESDFKAIEQFEKRFSMPGGNQEERYLAGLFSAEIHQEAKKMDAEKFLRVGALCHRPEHNFALAVYYRNKRELEQSMEYSSKCIKFFGRIPNNILLHINELKYNFYMPYTHLVNGIVFDKSHIELRESIEALRKANEKGLIPKDVVDTLKTQSRLNGFKIFK